MSAKNATRRVVALGILQMRGFDVQIFRKMSSISSKVQVYGLDLTALSPNQIRYLPLELLHSRFAVDGVCHPEWARTLGKELACHL